MGLTTKTINSSLLGKKMNIAVCVPDAYENIPLPVLYFLHGRTGNETLLQWFEMDKRASSLIESGIIKPLIIVCPNMDNSRGINSSEHYIFFVAATSSDDMQMRTLYPEGNAEARFKIRGVRRIFFYCNRDGLFSIDPVKGIDDKESGYDDSQERRELEKAADMLFG